MIWKKPRFIILVVLIILAFIVLVVNGLKFGLDFKGGTQFTLALEEPVTDPETMERITSTISQRLDWSGLKDIKVSSWENQFILVQVAESDPKEIEKIEEMLRKQGRFENIMNGEILFTGDDIVSVSKNPQMGYGVVKQNQGYRWTLPFTLNANAARRFAEKVFHKCVLTPSQEYQCPETYFFIDRPTKAIILVPRDLYQAEEFMSPDPLYPSSSTQIKFDQIMENAQIPYLIVDSLDENTLEAIKDLLVDNNKTQIIVPEGFETEKLKDLNAKIVEVAKVDPYPWIWTATGLKSVVWVDKSLTNADVPSVDSPSFKVFYNLNINGSARTREEALEKLNKTFVILASGSLPVPIDSISKEVVSPTLGSNFLTDVLIMGIVALLVVMLIIYIRYRNWRLVLPIFFTSASEVFLVLGFASLIKWNLDLAALAGIIAAVGTGIDNQVIITDELLRGDKKEKEEYSLVTRVKRAFFIITASASTTVATMFPIMLFGFGLGKLVGFALTTIAGVLIGVLITRPAYAEVAKEILKA